MNNYPEIFNPDFFSQYEINFKNLNNQIYLLRQELRRLDRRLLNLEKNFVSPGFPYTITPTPMGQSKLETMNNDYSGDNYMI